MKNIVFFLFVAMLCSIGPGRAQTCPANLDFEDGDFTNWECFTGKTKVSLGQNIIDLTLSGPQAGRHEIISASTSAGALDMYGKFPVLCPYGGNYSVKLGNDASGAEAEGMSYTFTVPSTIDTFTFTYFYAVVFEDPDHSLEEQPRFFVTAYEVATGKLINCASFDYIANGGIPGFQASPGNSGVLYKDWSPVSLQFAGLGGKSVRLEFRTADCTIGGHFGYAYLDVGSGCSNIMATAPYCIETNSLILNAPYGFASYTWYDQNFTTIIGKQQSLTLSPPPATSGIFYVDVIPYAGYGCRDTLQAIVKPLPVPDIPAGPSEFTYCQFASAPQLTATPTRGNDLLWYTSANGGIGTNTAPLPKTTVSGTTYYYVSQKVLFGCESLRKKITVKVFPTPAASFSINKVRQCQVGNDYVFTSTSTNRSNSVFYWSLGDGQTISSAGDSVVHHTYINTGSLLVKLKVTNDSACSTEKTATITVVSAPLATFTYPPIVCEKQIPVNIVNTSSVPGNASTINKWWWSINGAIEQTVNPAVTTPGQPGPILVKLAVSTAEGCLSDTTNANLFVHYRPAAAFTYSRGLCDNELIRFTDLSQMPAGSSPEAIVKWNWQFDNVTTSLQQHPTTNFTQGVHHARLVTETNFGCKSPETDSSFVINPKPQIQLTINDSCINRTINYKAIDVLNTVAGWYWDFGTGFYSGGPVISQSYQREGYRPLTLMASTAHGCRDTIVRPFTIYDNKALAGRDTVAAWGEPVQLNAHGGPNVKYVWSPGIGLNDPAIEYPVALLNQDQLYHLDAITDKGCDSHSKIFIKRYDGPTLYIPTAFTPNADGRNDVLRVIPAGIRSFGYFAVYNRWGQRMFQTTDYHQGWDGTFGGMKVDGGTYVAHAVATDYKGNPLVNKATVVLLR